MLMKKSYFDQSLVGLIIRQLFDYKWFYLGALVALYCLHYFQSEIPELAKNLGEFVGQGRLNEIDTGYFLLLALYIVIFRTASRLLFFTPARYMQRDFRYELVQILEGAHPSRYASKSQGQIFQTLYNDMDRLRGLIGFGLLQVGNIIIAAYVFIPRISKFEPKLLGAFWPLFLGIVIFMTVVFIFQPYGKKNMDAQGEMQQFIIESYHAKSTIKNYHAEKSFKELFNKASLFELKYFLIASAGYIFSIPLLRLSFGASLLLGAWTVYENNMGASSLIFFSGFLYLVLEPLMFLSWIGIVFVAAYNGWKRIKELTDLLNSPSEIENELEVEGSTSELYKIHWWEKLIDIKIRPYTWTVICGETGVGKSTLLHEVADIAKKLSIKISLVHQEPYIFNGTIADNIFLGHEPTQDNLNRAIEYIKLFGLDILRPNVDEILGMEVGENGKKISGGQAKRLVLIRSLFSDADFIIWDDPFSSVDFILEKEIINKLKNIPDLKKKTFLLSSHRLSTVRYCDELILLDKSGVIDRGQSSEKLKEGTISSEYFKKQLV